MLKWILGILGTIFLGPLGAISGFILGAVFDNLSKKTKEHIYSQGGDAAKEFVSSLLVLTAAVMKADGKVTKSELDYVKQYYVKIFGEEVAKDVIFSLRDVLQKDIPIYYYINELNNHTTYSSRLQLLHFLFGIAASDSDISTSELNKITEIAGYLRIHHSDFESIKSMFYGHFKNQGSYHNQFTQIENCYKILGVSSDTTDEELKKAYKKKAIEFHPDKVASLGKDIQEASKEKFQKLNEAWETIKKQRNIN